MRQPVRCPRTGLWLARVTYPNGRVRQVGRFERKRDAQAAIAAEQAKLDESPEQRRARMTVREFFEEWPEQFPRHPRTVITNTERIERYVLPYLPRRGDIPLRELRRRMMRELQATLLGKGLGKETIDGVFSAFSAMLSDAVDDELIDVNPARAFRVRPGDPRLRPKKPPRPRRSVPPEEVGAFMAAQDPRFRAVSWAAFLTGARPGELFAMRREEIDRERHLIYLHETVDRYGTMEPGLKTTHHIAEKELRGRWTLFPPSLLELVDELPAHRDGLLFHTPMGKVISMRNFYRSSWDPARSASGARFSLYDARHTFSSWLLSSGVPLIEVAGWMGHSLRAGGIGAAPHHAKEQWRSRAGKVAEARATKQRLGRLRGVAESRPLQKSMRADAAAPPGRDSALSRALLVGARWRVGPFSGPGLRYRAHHSASALPGWWVAQVAPSARRRRRAARWRG